MQRALPNALPGFFHRDHIDCSSICKVDSRPLTPRLNTNNRYHLNYAQVVNFQAGHMPHVTRSYLASQSTREYRLPWPRPARFLPNSQQTHPRILTKSLKQKGKNQLTIHPHHQRKLPLLPPLLQKPKYLPCGPQPLQNLPVQLRLLHVIHTNPPLHSHLGTPIIPSRTTTRNQIRHARALLRKGPRLDPRIWKKHVPKLDHFEEANAHDGRFGVVAPLEAGDETCGEGDDIFEGAGEGDGSYVGDDVHVEVGAVEEGVQSLVIDGGVGVW